MSKPGVLLINLGSPNSPSIGDVRRYLREFLMDERVLDVPYLTRWFIVHACILPFRPRQSAEAYEKIWLSAGSPLIVTNRRVQALLQQRVSFPVELAMRYQNPSVERAIHTLDQKGVNNLLLIPMFPHYAMSSYETAVERVRRVLAQKAPEMQLTVLPPYYDDPDYIQALSGSAAEAIEPEFDHLLFSFHGVPERQIRKSDMTGSHCLQTPQCCETASPAHRACYRAQCFKTVHAFARAASIPSGKYSVAFQSRLGRNPWLTPYADHELVRLAQAGVKKLVVICPSFVADCLETLEEMGIRGRESFLRAGGSEFRLVPCLNDHPLWLEALERMISRVFPIAPEYLAKLI